MYDCAEKGKQGREGEGRKRSRRYEREKEREDETRRKSSKRTGDIVNTIVNDDVHGLIVLVLGHLALGEGLRHLDF